MFPYDKLPENIRKFVKDLDTSIPSGQNATPQQYEQIIQHQLMSIDSASFKNHVNEVINDFHAHLDVCYQCRNHPMNLCPTGAVLLQRAAFPPNTGK